MLISSSYGRVLALLALAGCTSAKASSRLAPATHPDVNVVLVHGALTDASVWGDVTRTLQAEGYSVSAPAMPLRGLASDAAYLATYLKTIKGPIVLVGHSWAGAVISQAGTSSADVKALVYVAAFQPDDGEAAGALNSQFPGSKLGPDTTVVREYPGGKELYLKPESFREVYAGDVSAPVAATMAAMQRPIDPAALSEPLQGHAAWHSLPSWAVVSTRDFSIPPAALRFMASRARSHIEEVESSHAVPVAHPDIVVKTIHEAIQSVAAH